MNEYKTFDNYLKYLLNEKNIKYTELSKILGYKSKTTLSRALNNQTKISGLSNICDDLLNCNSTKFYLSKEEKLKLTESLEISRLGVESFKSNMTLLNLLKTHMKSEIVFHLYDFRNSTTKILSFKELLGVDSKDYVDIIVLNCAWRSVSSSLLDLIYYLSNNIHIRHYIRLTEDSSTIIRTIDGILPLLYNKKYSAYTIHDCDFNTQALEYNTVLIKKTGKNSTEEYQLIMHTQTDGMVIQNNHGIYSYWENIVSEYEEYYSPIKSEFKDIITSADYVAFTENYKRMEFQNDIFTYHPDIPMNYVSSEIAKRAFLDKINSSKAYISDINKCFDQLVAIHDQRFYNIFNQKHFSQAVMSTQAILKFAKTGIQTDHFFAMRPYTINERIEIFTTLMDQIINNPYFNLYLLKNDDEYIEMEATCFSKIGVQFTSSKTDYNLADSHTEVLITQKEFKDLFISFFGNELVKKQCQPQSATIALFKALISEMRNISY